MQANTSPGDARVQSGVFQGIHVQWTEMVCSGIFLGFFRVELGFVSGQEHTLSNPPPLAPSLRYLHMHTFIIHRSYWRGYVFQRTMP